MLKDLLEQFAILEGDVVSFADFKAKKDGEEIKEEPKTDGKKQIEIKSIKIIAKEGKQDGNPFELGKEYSYEEAQKLINEADYIVWNCDLLDGGYDKTDYIATILVNGEEDEYKGRIDLGDGKSNIMAVNIKYTMQHFLDSQYPNEYFVNAPDITYDYEEFAKKYGTKEENINKRVANNKKELPTGVNSAAKSLDEIGIGDIFVKSGYDDYYRRNYYVFFEVTKRTKSSVWLRPIGSKKIEQPINNNGQLDYENYCIPDVAKERQNGSYGVDFEKPYRLSLGYDNKILCSQGSGYRKETYYAWNGKALKEGFEMKKSIYAKLNEDLKPYLHEFYNVEGLDSVEMTIVSLGMEDGIETLELDGVQFCRAEDEELSNAIDICIEEEFMPEWEEQGIVSYNVDSVQFDKEDGNGVAYVGLFRGDDLDETVKVENKAEKLKKIFEDAFKNGKMNCFETAKGVVYVEPQGEQLVYGGMTNGGIIPEYKFDYDFNHSFDWNLQGHIEQIMEEEGYPEDDLDESLNEKLDKTQTYEFTIKKVKEDKLELTSGESIYSVYIYPDDDLQDIRYAIEDFVDSELSADEDDSENITGTEVVGFKYDMETGEGEFEANIFFDEDLNEDKKIGEPKFKKGDIVKDKDLNELIIKDIIKGNSENKYLIEYIHTAGNQSDLNKYRKESELEIIKGIRLLELEKFLKRKQGKNESLNEDIPSLDDIVFLEEDPLYDGECYPKRLPYDEENKYYVAMGYKDYRNSEDGKLVKATPDYEKSTGLVKIPYSEFEDGFGMAYQDSFDEAPDEETIDMYCLGNAVYFKEVVDEKELLLNFTVLADVEDHHLEYDVTGKWIPPKSLNESLNEEKEKLYYVVVDKKGNILSDYYDKEQDLLDDVGSRMEMFTGNRKEVSIAEFTKDELEEQGIKIEESLNEDESVEEKLQKIADEVKAEINKIYADDKDLLEYFVVEPLIKEGHYNDGSTLYGIEVRTELGYNELLDLSEKLDKIVQKYDKDAYFDMEGGGIITAVISDDKNEEEITPPRYSVIGMNLERNEKEGIGIVWDKDFDDSRKAMKFAQEKGKEEPQHVIELIDTINNQVLYNSQKKNESLKESKKLQEGLYGLPDVEYISHGDWSDGEVEYQGFLYNAADLTEFVYDDYAEYCKENNEQESDEGFDEWIKDNNDCVYSALSVLTPHEAYAIFKNKELIAIYGNADTAFTKAFEMGAEEQEDGFLSGEFDVAEMKDYKWVRSNRYVDMPDGGVIRDVEESDWAKVQVNESLAEAVEKYPKQLAQAIKKCWYGDYKDKGRYAKIGKWEIGLGGYDTGYEVSFDGTPIFAIRTTWGDNKVDMYQDEDDIKNLCGYNFKQIMKAINEVDPETILNEPEQMYRLVIKTDEDNLSDVNEILGHYSEIEADDIDDNSYDSIICFYVNKNDKDILNQIYKDLKELNNDAIELKEPFEIY